MMHGCKHTREGKAEVHFVLPHHCKHGLSGDCRQATALGSVDEWLGGLLTLEADL